MDAVSVFLNGRLQETIYLKRPEGLATLRPGDNTFRDTGVFRLKKALYGLKQAGRTRSSQLDDVLRSLGFNPSSADECVYVATKCIIVVFVDDLLLAGPDLNDLETLISDLEQHFRLKRLGHAPRSIGYKQPRPHLSHSYTNSGAVCR